MFDFHFNGIVNVGVSIDCSVLQMSRDTQISTRPRNPRVIPLNGPQVGNTIPQQ